MSSPRMFRKSENYSKIISASLKNVSNQDCQDSLRIKKVCDVKKLQQC